MLALLVSTACGGGAPDPAAAETAGPPPEIQIPTPILGLRVGSEDIASQLELPEGERSYIDSVGLFAFRKEEEVLEATLEVARFTPDARPESPAFRGSIISRIGGTNPVDARVGDQQVSMTSGRSQVVFVWFKGRGLFILTVRRDFPFPRGLLRKIVDLGIEV